MRTLALLTLAACTPITRGDRVDRPTTFPVDRGTTPDEDVAAAVEDEVLAFLDGNTVPGIAVAVVAGGEVVYTGGFGWADVAAERPLTADTPVLLSSVSKTLVGVLAARAAADGLDLDTPAGTLLGYPVVARHGSTVTLRHLLTHHSGVEDSAVYDAHYADGDPTVSLDRFCADYLSADGELARRGNWSSRAAGEGFSYSNVGMACAAQALADHAGTDVDTLVRQTILEPLGMTDTAYLLADLETPAAIPYTPSGRRLRAWTPYGYPTYPDGMIRSPAEDLGRYVAAMASGAPTLLPRDAWNAMITVDPALGTDEDGQALAWAMRELDGVPMIGHNGGDYGSSAELWFDPATGDGFALAANGHPTSFADAIELERRLMALVDD
jgi:CubicO group peptidase (beta-lactamase class C family)